MEYSMCLLIDVGVLRCCRYRGICLDGRRRWHTLITMNELWQTAWWASKEEGRLVWSLVLPRLKPTTDGEPLSTLSGAAMALVLIFISISISISISSMLYINWFNSLAIGIESFSKLGDSIYFEEGGSSPALYIIQYISSSFNWRSGQIAFTQQVDPVVSWDPHLRVVFTFTSNQVCLLSDQTWIQN